MIVVDFCRKISKYFAKCREKCEKTFVLYMYSVGIVLYSISLPFLPHLNLEDFLYNLIDILS
jgi:hypothetical protein